MYYREWCSPRVSVRLVIFRAILLFFFDTSIRITLHTKHFPSSIALRTTNSFEIFSSKFQEFHPLSFRFNRFYYHWILLFFTPIVKCVFENASLSRRRRLKLAFFFVFFFVRFGGNLVFSHHFITSETSFTAQTTTTRTRTTRATFSDVTIRCDDEM